MLAPRTVNDSISASSTRRACAGMAAAALALAGTLMPLSCGRTITRVDPNQTIDLDYRFNDADARQVYQGMVNDALYRRWLGDFKGSHAGNRPVVIVGPIKNKTQEYIETDLFTKQWERELLNSGDVRFVAVSAQRDDIRDEREQGQEWNTPETRKQMRAELGADLILIGTILDNKERSADNKALVNYYNVSLELVDLETNEKVWIGIQEIKKLVRG